MWISNLSSHSKSASPNLYDTLGTLVCDGDTNTVEGLYNGFDQIKNTINQAGALNVIVLFTDGQANAFTGSFELKDQADNRYDVWNTNQIVPVPKSSCSGTSPITGVFADATSETASDITGLALTGWTGGLATTTGIPLNQHTGWPLITASGCSFYQNRDARYFRQDIKGLPAQDIHGNSTVDGGYLPLDYFQAGNPFQGYIRPDMPRDARWAAMNAADSMAQTIRYDKTYTTIIYTIGLQGNEPMAIDQDFMKRVANDPTKPAASNYDPTRPAGKFILATDTGELSQAFQQVASQILRLSR
jgi:hypothetical protein